MSRFIVSFSYTEWDVTYLRGSETLNPNMVNGGHLICILIMRTIEIISTTFKLLKIFSYYVYSICILFPLSICSIIFQNYFNFDIYKFGASMYREISYKWQFPCIYTLYDCMHLSEAVTFEVI